MKQFLLFVCLYVTTGQQIVIMQMSVSHQFCRHFEVPFDFKTDWEVVLFIKKGQRNQILGLLQLYFLILYLLSFLTAAFMFEGFDCRAQLVSLLTGFLSHDQTDSLHETILTFIPSDIFIEHHYMTTKDIFHSIDYFFIVYLYFY